MSAKEWINDNFYYGIDSTVIIRINVIQNTKVGRVLFYLASQNLR